MIQFSTYEWITFTGPVTPPISKSIMSSMSFGHLIHDLEPLKQVIATYAAESAAKMRRENLACNAIGVFLETHRFIDEPQYYPWVKIPLPYPTDHTGEIISTAVTALESVYQEGYRFLKGGVLLDGLIPIEERQTSLFDSYERERIARLMIALDSVNSIYGPGTLRYGAQGFKNRFWKMKQEHLSSEASSVMSQFQQVKRVCELGQSTPLFRTL